MTVNLKRSLNTDNILDFNTPHITPQDPPFANGKTKNQIMVF